MMHRFEIHARKQLAVSLVALTAGGLGMSACGGSSGGAGRTGASATHTATQAASSTALQRALKGQASGHAGSAPSSAQSAARARALRNLLLRHAKHPAGIAPGVGARPSAAANAFRQALMRFATCLRSNGVNMPLPNASGKGPILGTRGIKTNTPQFRAASAKCRATLLSALRSSSPRIAGRPATKH